MFAINVLSSRTEKYEDDQVGASILMPEQLMAVKVDHYLVLNRISWGGVVMIPLAMTKMNLLVPWVTKKTLKGAIIKWKFSGIGKFP